MKVRKFFVIYNAEFLTLCLWDHHVVFKAAYKKK